MVQFSPKRVAEAVQPIVRPPNTPAPNAPRLVNFTGNSLFGTGGYGGDTLEALALRQKELSQVGDEYLKGPTPSPFQGAAFVVNKLGNAIRQGQVDTAEDQQRQALVELMGGIDRTKGATPEQIARAYGISTELGNSLYSQEPAEQWEPVPGQPNLQRNVVTGKIEEIDAGAGGSGSGADLGDLNTLRDDVRDSAKTYSDAWGSFQSMKDAANLTIGAPEDAEGLGAADYNMIVAYAKMLDPQSVVREGEVRNAQMSEGDLQMIKGWLQSWRERGTLTDPVRRAIMAQANSRMRSYYSQARNARDWFDSFAEGRGIRADEVAPPLDPFEEWKEQQREQEQPDTPQPDADAPGTIPYPPMPDNWPPDQGYPDAAWWKNATQAEQQEALEDIKRIQAGGARPPAAAGGQ